MGQELCWRGAFAPASTPLVAAPEAGHVIELGSPGYYTKYVNLIVQGQKCNRNQPKYMYNITIRTCASSLV